MSTTGGPQQQQKNANNIIKMLKQHGRRPQQGDKQQQGLYFLGKSRIDTSAGTTGTS
jgi:hypothetical protein